MSQFVDGGVKGYVATADIAEGLNVKISAGKIVVATAATDKIIGTTMGAYKAGETASIRLRSAAGTCKGKAGGTIAIGDRLTTNGSGQFIATTTAANEVCGVAVEAAVSGDFFEFSPATNVYAIT